MQSRQLLSRYDVATRGGCQSHCRSTRYETAVLRKRLIVLAALSAAAVGLGGCATKTPVSGTFPAISPRAAQSDQYVGKTVRWGGVLVETTPKSEKTCFRVMGLPLKDNGRPEKGQGIVESGRFLACASGFYDPVLYAAGREITFVGKVTGVVRESVGKYKYPYPRLAASIVYLWPKTSIARSSGYYNGYFNMYYGWGPWGWGGPSGWWGYPWGGFPPVYLPTERDHDRDHDRDQKRDRMPHFRPPPPAASPPRTGRPPRPHIPRSLPHFQPPPPRPIPPPPKPSPVKPPQTQPPLR